MWNRSGGVKIYKWLELSSILFYFIDNLSKTWQNDLHLCLNHKYIYTCDMSWIPDVRVRL